MSNFNTFDERNFHIPIKTPEPVENKLRLDVDRFGRISVVDVQNPRGLNICTLELNIAEELQQHLPAAIQTAKEQRILDLEEKIKSAKDRIAGCQEQIDIFEKSIAVHQQNIKALRAKA